MGVDWTYIDDHSCAPHVKAPVVAFVSQDFRRQIGRCSDDGLAERLLANDTSESEIAKFHLESNKQKGPPVSKTQTVTIHLVWGHFLMYKCRVSTFDLA